MSHTPIYDELRELRLDERTDVPAATQPTIRLVVPQSEGGIVSLLASRRGLGGRHRRPAN
jgi:hypothetical protein